jgi:hypothetical protein
MDNVVIYAAVLDMRGRTVMYLADLLAARREQVGSREGTRALTCFEQAVLVIRWFLDGSRVARLVADNGIGVSTGYRYLHEGIDALAAQAPDLRTALESAKCDKVAFLSLDGVVFPTDRVAAPGPNGADLWWSGKHKHHGGNIQVLTRPDGWPAWVSPVRPGREHDMTAARTHGLIAPLAEMATLGIRTLADLGYEGAADTLIVPVKKKPGVELTEDQKTFNLLQRGTRGQGERAHALLIMRFKALRRITLCPWKIGRIVAAALVLLNHENDRTLAIHSA